VVPSGDRFRQKYKQRAFSNARFALPHIWPSMNFRLDLAFNLITTPFMSERCRNRFVILAQTLGKGLLTVCRIFILNSLLIHRCLLS
jgi:hypothetical protein